ncbi:MAG: hypothetical protein HC886_01990 [Leptolyngbyaceae cyanobacterium SM1_1_3]|nr:hypothetical protein [Leptolyngbyaceae cyanobacterium SM1_1_3]NJN03100.1 hypothetical protein [Leptolyngbyaceae cyanobacterium RM1_1_2]NJO09600.1 hypothetical protein [Leptolyngbyaceae cyanobacterium SL_1_1]
MPNSSSSSKPNDSRKTLGLIRSAGYGLLIIFALQLADIFIPAYFMDSDWEMGMVANLIERMPLALIALVLVFFGEMNLRQRWEKWLLWGLSWSTLVASVLFFALVPLSVSSSVKLRSQGSAQVQIDARQQMIQLEELQARVNNATSQEMNALAEALIGQSITLEVNDSQALEEQLLAEIDSAKKQVVAQRESADRSQWLTLQKSALKWSLSAIVSAFLFFSIWHLTDWARQPKPSKPRS